MAAAATAMKSLTKSQIVQDLADRAGLSTKQVKSVLEGLCDVVTEQISKKDGVVNLLGLIKVSKIVKPAQKGGQQKPNPFKPGEMMTTKAKPARTVVKVRPLKALKDAV